jgi:integrase
MAGGGEVMMQVVFSYLALRRSLGFKLRSEELLLRSFARFAAERSEKQVRTSTALEWAALASSPSRRDKRLRCVAAFARHARAEDPGNEVPPVSVFVRGHRRSLPYIFSPDEVRRFLAEASRLGRADTLDPLTSQTLFGLLFVTGLRISEIRALLLSDIMDDGIVVRETKCRKSRLLPLHATTAAALDRYLQRRRRVAGTDDHVFVTSRGVPIGYKWVFLRFKKVLRVLGLYQIPGRRRPHIHDMRHTFAVHALETCPLQRDEVRRHLVALKTYLGHAHIADTYWYLQATPRLMADLADACELLSKQDHR